MPSSVDAPRLAAFSLGVGEIIHQHPPAAEEQRQTAAAHQENFARIRRPPAFL